LAKVIAPILRAAVLRVQEEIGKGHHVHEAVQRAMPRGTWEANFKKKIRPVLYALALAGAQHEWNLWAPRHRFQVVRWLKAPPDPLTHRIDMPPDIVQAVEEIADGRTRSAKRSSKPSTKACRRDCPVEKWRTSWKT